MKKQEKIGKDRLNSEFLRHSEIRNGEFIRYHGKEEEITIPDTEALKYDPSKTRAHDSRWVVD